MLIPTERSHERDEPCHRANTRPPHESLHRTETLLRSHETIRHLRPLLRRQLQRHTQEIQEHGSQIVRLSLSILSFLYFLVIAI